MNRHAAVAEEAIARPGKAVRGAFAAGTPFEPDDLVATLCVHIQATRAVAEELRALRDDLSPHVDHLAAEIGSRR